MNVLLGDSEMVGVHDVGSYAEEVQDLEDASPTTGDILLCGENLGMLQAALLTLQLLLDRMVSAYALMPYG